MPRRAFVAVLVVLVVTLFACGASAQPQLRGRWSPPFNTEAVAIHATLMRGAGDSFHWTWWSGFDGAVLHDWTYVPGPFDSSTSFPSRTLAPTPDNFYESGFTLTAAGRLISLGGLARYHNDGTTRAKLYDPVSHGVTTLTPIGVERFEPSPTSLPDGRVLVSGGTRWTYAVGFGGRVPRPGSPGEREARNDLLRLATHPVPVWEDSSQDGWGSSRRPPPLEQHSVVYDVGGFARMLVFGGHDATAPGGPEVVNATVWQLQRFDDDLTREVVWTWDTVTTTPDPVFGRPEGRWAHGAVITPDRRMIVFGGRSPAGALGDVWQLALPAAFFSPSTWKKLSPAPDPVSGSPGARWGHAVVYDQNLNRMLVFGGRDAAGLASDDCWELSLGATPAWHRLASSGQPREGGSAVYDNVAYRRVWIYGGRGASGVRGDVMEYALDTDAWRTPVLASGSPVPPARADHAAFLGGDDYMTISGGELADGSLDDRVWRLQFMQPFFEPTLLKWVQDPLQPNGPGPRAGHSLLWEDILVTSRRFEVYDPEGSTAGVPGSVSELPASAKRFTWFYPSLFVLPGGHVFHANGNNTAMLDLATSAWMPVAGGAFGGTAGQIVHYAPGRIMRSGGNSRAGITDVIAFDDSDHTTGWANWTLGVLNPRILHKATLLPTGDVLVTGGVRDPSDPLGVRVPQLWNETTGWTDTTLLAPEPVYRNYHGTSLLLPDGRVLTAGGSTVDASQLKGAVYEPPYLFDATGALVRQTVVTGVPGLAGYGSILTLGTEVAEDAAAITGACVMRACADTHDANFEQRRVPLAPTHDGNLLHVTLPATPNLAPPGDYLLFLLRDVSGVAVPSIARWIRLSNTGPVLGVPAPGAARMAFARPWPNPAAADVRFSFTLTHAGGARLSVLDVAGRRVRTLEIGSRAAGAHTATWDRRDDAGRALAPGLYFARLEAEGETIAWPVVLQR